MEADNIIRKIFKYSKFIDSDRYLDRAVFRHRLGNPPGKKNNSYGDELNWEALLSEISDGENLTILSNDGDFESAISKGKINDFLKKRVRKKERDFWKGNFRSLACALDFPGDVLSRKMEILLGC